MHVASVFIELDVGRLFPSKEEEDNMLLEVVLFGPPNLSIVCLALNFGVRGNKG